MLKRFLTTLACMFALTLCCLAQGKKSSPKAAADSPVPDKALMQKLLDGWSTLDPANVAAHYPQGPHTYFDIAPLKYNNWDEYSAGVKKLDRDLGKARRQVAHRARTHLRADRVARTILLGLRRCKQRLNTPSQRNKLSCPRPLESQSAAPTTAAVSWHSAPRGTRR